MTAIPEPTNSISALIDAAHEKIRNAEPQRNYLGASVLGHPCDRWLWLSFRWAVIERFPGRILRVFRRGQNEEATVVSDLRAIGMDVRATGAQQSRCDFGGGHIGGHVDGIIHAGVPGAEKTKHILEIKTHSKKSFDDLEKNGVEKSKHQHFVQMQLYMLGMKIDRALYVAVCKDDDRIYTERVRFDEELAQKYLERGRRLTLEDRMPPPISTDPSWYQCKFCAAHDLCHGSKLTKEVNCRTCAHSTAKEDGSWRCERHDADGIPVEWQQQGCDSHVLHFDLVPWKMAEPRDQWTAVFLIDGQAVANGEPDATVFGSREIVGNPLACSNPPEFVKQLRAAFDGRIVG